jgi:adenosine deaminase
MARTVQQIKKVELHQHLDGSIPLRTTWGLMKQHGLNPVPTLREMRGLLQFQEDERGSLLSYLLRSTIRSGLPSSTRTSSG